MKNIAIICNPKAGYTTKVIPRITNPTNTKNTITALFRGRLDKLIKTPLPLNYRWIIFRHL